METAEASCWTSFDLSIPAGEESEVMALLFAERDDESSIGLQPMLEADHTSYYCSDSANTSYYWPLGNFSTTSVSEANASNYFSANTDYENGYSTEYTNAVHVISVNSQPIEFNTAVQDQTTSPSFVVDTHYSQFNLPFHVNDEASSDDNEDSIERPAALPFVPHNDNVQVTKRKFHTTEKPRDMDSTPLESCNKKKKPSGLVVSKRRKNAQCGLKTQKSEDFNAQSSSSHNSSEDDEQSKCATENQNGKTRASRGSATDPQSLYARKRRERINERLRILQNLVPNGTKVDISTMLEEAVQYVKFLQLQIKLLSSDELWMYAPIAYNGMNIGLDVKITQET